MPILGCLSNHDWQSRHVLRLAREADLSIVATWWIFDDEGSIAEGLNWVPLNFRTVLQPLFIIMSETLA